MTEESSHTYNKRNSHSIKNNGRCLRHLAKCNKESNIINLIKVYDMMMMMMMMLGRTLGICFSCFSKYGAGANQFVHWFLGGKGLGIQQGMSV